MYRKDDSLSGIEVLAEISNQSDGFHMTKEKKAKKKCCEKFEKKGKRCKNCPDRVQDEQPHGKAEKKKKKK
jgi:hypothetical protein